MTSRLALGAAVSHIRSMWTDADFREIARGAAAGLLLNGLGALVGFFFNVLVGRTLGTDGAGIFFLAFSAMLLVGVVGRAGLDTASLRFIASALGGDPDPVRARRSYALTVQLVALFSLIAAAAVIASAGLLAKHVFDEPGLARPLQIMGAAIVPFNLLVVHSEALRALKRVSASIFAKTTGLYLVAIPLVVTLTAPYGVTGAAVAVLVSSCVVLLTGALFVHHYLPGPSRTGEAPHDPALVGSLFRTARPLFLVASMTLLATWADTIMLGFWEPSDQVGIYAAAARTAALLSMVLTATNWILPPHFASLHAAGDKRRLGRSYGRSLYLSAGLALPPFLLLILFPRFFLGIFGSGFEEGATVLRILSVGWLVSAATGANSYLLAMIGKERTLRNITVSATLMNIALNVVLIPPFGILGASLATLASLTINNVLGLVFVGREVPLWVLPRGWRSGRR